MGTSVTHRSPRTLSWNAVQVGYENALVPEARILRDVWRAALVEPQSSWASLLGSDAVANCLTVLTTSEGPADAVVRATAAIAASGASSLATEVAKRAVAGSFGADDRAREFTARVFAGATDYLVSRDLAGHVGRGNRLGTVREATAFKERLKRQAAATAREIAGREPRSRDWGETVARVARALAER
jgi:hypothetical protein